MIFRVIQPATGEHFAAFARHHLEHAVAATIDLAELSGEPFAVIDHHDDSVVFTYPPPTTTTEKGELQSWPLNE